MYSFLRRRNVGLCRTARVGEVVSGLLYSSPEMRGVLVCRLVETQSGAYGTPTYLSEDDVEEKGVMGQIGLGLDALYMNYQDRSKMDEREYDI